MTKSEPLPSPSNPLGMAASSSSSTRPRSRRRFGALLQTMGFMPVARHRSREVMLYRQGAMNLIVNAHPRRRPAWPRRRGADASAIALRVRDAGEACRHALDLGAWEMPTRASAMELNIPGIHGVGDSLDLLRRPLPRLLDLRRRLRAAARHRPAPPAIAGLHYFGVVQTILDERTRDWVDFYRQLFGFSVLPGGQYFGMLPKGTLLESPCHKFYLQLIEPPPGAEDIEWDERLVRDRPRRAATCRRRCGRCASAASCSSTATRCSRATRAPSPRSTSVASRSSWW